MSDQATEVDVLVGNIPVPVDGRGGPEISTFLTTVGRSVGGVTEPGEGRTDSSRGRAL